MDFVEEICVKHGNCGDEFESNHKQVLAFTNNPIPSHHKTYHPENSKKFTNSLKSQQNVSTTKNSRKILKCLKNVYWICRKSLRK
jgi:hypothetical protein